MFNFENTKHKFNFNQNRLNENNFASRLALSINDFDFDDDMDDIDDISDKIISTKKISSVFDFRTFLNVNIFNAAGIKFDTTDEYTGYVWREEIYNKNKWYIAYINYPYSNIKHTTIFLSMYVAYNYDTNDLYIGNCNSFKHSRWAQISYPFIKICEKYIMGKVYIGDIYVDLSYGYRDKLQNVLDKIAFPLEFNEISGSITFFRGYWNNVAYYLPDMPAVPTNISIPDHLKLSHAFCEHLGGFSNKFVADNKFKHKKQDFTFLYYDMFSNIEDYAKVISLLCEQGFIVKNDQLEEYTQDNYQMLLKRINANLDKSNKHLTKIKQDIIDKETRYKDILTKLLGENVIDLYESSIKNYPGNLSLYALIKERKSKDVYRKFDLPLIEEILKDNGIDIDKIVKRKEDEWENSLNTFIDIYCDYAKIDPNDYNYANYYNAFISDYIQYKNKLPNDCIDLITQIMSGFRKYVKPKDLSTLSGDEKERALLYNYIVKISKYGYQSIFPADSNESEWPTIYNRWCLLQRFVYLFNYALTDRYDIEILYKTNMVNIEPTYYGSKCISRGYNLSDIKANIRLNNYESLYKLVYIIAFAVENGYNNIHSNFCFETYYVSYIGKVLYNDRYYYTTKFVNDEIGVDNKPNLKTFNTTSLARGLNTMFNNITKKIQKNTK